MTEHWGLQRTSHRTHTMYDIIGDVHGHERALRRLLAKLGYQEERGCFSHPTRKVIFVGDIIDRGPQIRETLTLIRRMVEAHAALCVMGNHELNALGFHTPSTRRSSSPMRPRTPDNTMMHSETIRQVPEHELRNHLAWFRSLPLWLGLDGLRVVHACWDDAAVDTLEPVLALPMTDAFLEEACDRETEVFRATKTLLRGKKTVLPDSIRAWDRGGRPQTKARVRWYLDPSEKNFSDYLMPNEHLHGDAPITSATVAAARPYPQDAPPVFFGHYHITSPSPARLASNVACVDRSDATVPQLCCYRWSGEQELDDHHFVCVSLAEE